MKHFNKNLLVFFAAILLIGSGMFSRSFLTGIYYTATDLYRDLRAGKPDSVETFIGNLDALVVDRLANRDQLFTLNSIKDNLLGIRILPKDETIIVKSDSGTLLGFGFSPLREEAIAGNFSYVQNYYDLAQKNGVKFLYCAVPSKFCYAEPPANFPDCNKAYYDAVIRTMEQSRIPYIGMREELSKKGLDDESIFFITDHHMTPNTGFVAAGIICEELNRKYGFNYMEEALDLDNFTVETYRDYYLGGFGRNAGLYFTWHGADDIDLITPNFETSFVEEIPNENLLRTGSFEQTALHMDSLCNIHYRSNSYCVYSGGDYRLQIITNNRNPDGDVIVIVRNSMACVVTPFLALHAKQLHIIDDRGIGYPPGDPIDVAQYVKELQPDYLIVYQSPLSS